MHGLRLSDDAFNHEPSNARTPPVDSVDNHNCLETAPVAARFASKPPLKQIEDNHDPALFTAYY